MMPTKPIDLANPSLNALTPFQESMYWRIRNLFQRSPSVKETSAEPSDLKQTLYPLKRDLRESQVQSALTALILAGMIAVYPDDTGHPYLRLLSADSPTSQAAVGGTPQTAMVHPLKSVGGIIGGDDHRHHPLMIVSPPSKENGETAEGVPNTVPSPNGHPQAAEKGYAEMLGITDQDVAETMERRNAIEHEARECGLPLNARAMQMAEAWADEYSLDWLLKAIQQSALSAANWHYVLGTLRKWRERGSCDDLPPGQRRQQPADKSAAARRKSPKTDAELDAELKKWGVNLNE